MSTTKVEKADVGNKTTSVERVKSSKGPKNEEAGK